METFSIKDEVIWLGNRYIIIDIKNNKALLKQSFSIGTVLNNYIDIDELKQVYDFKANNKEY